MGPFGRMDTRRAAHSIAPFRHGDGQQSSSSCFPEGDAGGRDVQTFPRNLDGEGGDFLGGLERVDHTAGLRIFPGVLIGGGGGERNLCCGSAPLFSGKRAPRAPRYCRGNQPRFRGNAPRASKCV